MNPRCVRVGPFLVLLFLLCVAVSIHMPRGPESVVFAAVSAPQTSPTTPPLAGKPE